MTELRVWGPTVQDKAAGFPFLMCGYTGTFSGEDFRASETFRGDRGSPASLLAWGRCRCLRSGVREGPFVCLGVFVKPPVPCLSPVHGTHQRSRLWPGRSSSSALTSHLGLPSRPVLQTWARSGMLMGPRGAPCHLQGCLMGGNTPVLGFPGQSRKATP